MSDIKLSVGLETSVAGTDIQGDIQQLLKNIEATKPKISVDIELSKNSLSTFQKQLAQIVKTTSLGSGAPVNINIDGIGKITSEMKKLNQEATKTKQTLDSVSKSTTGAASQSAAKLLVKDTTEYNNALMKSQDLLAKLQSTQASYSAQIGSTAYTGITEQVAATENLIEQLTSGKVTAEQFAQSYSKITLETSNYTKSLSDVSKTQQEAAKKAQKYQSLLRQTTSLLSQLESAETNWTKARDGKSSDSYKNIQLYRNKVELLKASLTSGSGDIVEIEAALKRLNTQFIDSSRQIKSAGENTKSFGERITSLAGKFASWLSVSQVIMQVVQTAKKMVNTVVELDSAMTELKKVTDATEATYDRFLDNAVVRAKRVGASVTDVVTATADYARLGYTIDESSVLADTSIIYKNVADGITDISEASESIISTMQAFGIAASDAMSIVDKFNNVSNNFAISSAGIGEAMQKSAAAMRAAGNDIDETIALITAANTVVQNPESVGTTLKTVSMFLRAAKTEAEEAGESTEGMANSVSELRQEILDLTGHKVDIQIDENTFKSTYQIIQELSQVWEELTDISQANILELVGGKRNSNVVSALLENFDVAEKVLATSMNSAGSAMAENEKHLDSIAGKMDRFTASFEALSSTVVNSDFVGVIVDSGTVILDILNGIVDAIGLIGPALAGVGFTAFFKNLD